MDDIYLTLPSNTMDFPTNTPAEFRVALPNSLELNGEWELGLVEIQYPYSWNNLQGGTDTSKQDNWFLINMQPSYYNGVIEVHVPAGSYSDVDNLIIAIQEAVKNWKPPQDTKSKKSFDLSQLFKISYDKMYRRVKIKLKPTGIKAAVCGENLQYVLGYGGGWSRLFTKPVNYANYPPDLSAGFNTLYVYCDLVQPQIVGNILAPLIRTVPISGEFGETVDKVFLGPHYIPLRTKSFDTIEFSIKTDRNKPVLFNFGKVIVKVHLRRKQ